MGIQTLAEFQSLFTKKVEIYGTNYGASRLSNVQLEVYEKAEIILSQWVGSESCITMSSGYLAGQLVASFFVENKFNLFYAPKVHSSLQYGHAHIFEDYNALNNAVQNYLNKNREGTPVILLDTIDLSEDTYPNFLGLKSLPLETSIVIADDSHGVGLVGSDGNGCYKIINNLKPKELLVCCSLGKSLGLPTGAIFGSQPRIEELKATPFFSGASPASPASMAALVEAQPLYASQRRKLFRNMEKFRFAVKKIDAFESIEDYPVFVFKDAELTKFLFDRGICVTNFNYPAEKDSWQSRIVLSALHLENDILKLADLINEFYDKSPLLHQN